MYIIYVRTCIFHVVETNEDSFEFGLTGLFQTEDEEREMIGLEIAVKLHTAGQLIYRIVKWDCY